MPEAGKPTNRETTWKDEEKETHRTGVAFFPDAAQRDMVFIGVIMTGMEEAQKELAALDAKESTAAGKLAAISEQLAKLQIDIKALGDELRDSSSG